MSNERWKGEILTKIYFSSQFLIKIKERNTVEKKEA